MDFRTTKASKKWLTFDWKVTAKLAREKYLHGPGAPRGCALEPCMKPITNTQSYTQYTYMIGREHSHVVLPDHISISRWPGAYQIVDGLCKGGWGNLCWNPCNTGTTYEAAESCENLPVHRWMKYMGEQWIFAATKVTAA